MEGNKNAMYAQAGKSNGWTQGFSNEATMKIPAAPVMPQQKSAVAPVIPNMPNVSMPAAKMPEPKMPMPNMPMPNMSVPKMPMPNMPAPSMPAPNMSVPNMPAPNMPMPNMAELKMSMPNMPASSMPAPPMVVLPNAKNPNKDCQTLVMAYVPVQEWQELYEPDQGMSRGTIFTELDLPFVGEGACKHE